jgi:hypothetical protein
LWEQRPRVVGTNVWLWEAKKYMVVGTKTYIYGNKNIWLLEQTPRNVGTKNLWLLEQIYFYGDKFMVGETKL